MPAEGIDARLRAERQAYVVDLAWLRSTPWRERVAAAFDPPRLRPELRTIESVTLRHHPDSTVAAMLFVGWLASRLGWETDPLERRAGSARGPRRDADAGGGGAASGGGAGAAGAGSRGPHDDDEPRTRAAPGPRAGAACTPTTATLQGREREWTILGASRGETGILGEGIRQALLRDPTYVPALRSAQGLLA